MKEPTLSGVEGVIVRFHDKKPLAVVELHANGGLVTKKLRPENIEKLDTGGAIAILPGAANVEEALKKERAQDSATGQEAEIEERRNLEEVLRKEKESGKEKEEKEKEMERGKEKEKMLSTNRP